MAKKKRTATKKKAVVRKKVTDRTRATTKKKASRKKTAKKTSKKKASQRKTARKQATGTPATKKKPAKKKAATQKTTKRTTPEKKATTKKQTDPAKSTDDTILTRVDAPAAGIETGVAGVERSEPPDEATLATSQAATPLGAHSARPQPPADEGHVQPADAPQTDSKDSVPAEPDPTTTGVISYLESTDVLRSRIDPDTGRNVVQLYHDYLSRAVLEAERRADRWPTVAREAQHQFTEAGTSLFRRWRALLSPWQQIRLLIERLRPGTSFTYGGLKNFALFSLLRFTPHVVVMVSLLLGWQEWDRRELAKAKQEEARQQEAIDRRDRDEARRILLVVAGDTNLPTSDEYSELERLADRPPGVRLAVIDLLLESEDYARSLRNRYKHVLHAVIGLDVTTRDRVRDGLLKHGKEPGDKPLLIRTTIAELGVELSITNDRDLNKLILKSYVAALKETTDSRALSALADALGALGEKLDAKSATAGAEQIVTAMQVTTNVRTLSFLLSVLGGLGEKLDAKSATAVAEQIVTAMQATASSTALSYLEPALGALGETLDAKSATAVAEQIVTAMQATTDIFVLRALADALGGLGEKLDTKSATAGAEQFVAAMQATTNSDALSSLWDALGALAGKLDDDNLLSILKSVVCVGETRKIILDTVKERAKGEADVDVWMAVKWAEAQGVDVDAVSRWPLAP